MKWSALSQRNSHLVFSCSLNKHALGANSGQALTLIPGSVSSREKSRHRVDEGVVQEAADMVELMSHLKISVSSRGVSLSLEGCSFRTKERKHLIIPPDFSRWEDENAYNINSWMPGPERETQMFPERPPNFWSYVRKSDYSF